MASGSSTIPSQISSPSPPIVSPSTNPTFSQIDERSNPYYLHHNDNTGLVLVSHLLSGENYSSWSQSMMMALSVKNKLGFVDGSISRPLPSDSLYSSWIRNNHMVICWIANSSIKEIAGSVIYSKSARAVWLDLQERFSQQNGPRVYQLRREMMNLVQGQLSVSQYFTKLKTLWDELMNFRPGCSCGHYCCEGTHALADFYHTEYVMMFLMGLNDSFSQIRSQVLSMEPIPLINKAFALVSQEEQQRCIQSLHPTESLAFAVSQNNSRIQSNFSKQKKDRPTCTHCGIPGHTIDKCYKLHGYPPGYKFKPRVNQVSQTSSYPQSDSSKNFQPMASDSSSPAGTFMQSLNSDQCQQLMSLLTNHLEAAKIVPNSSTSIVPASGGNHFEGDWQS